MPLGWQANSPTRRPIDLIATRGTDLSFVTFEFVSSPPYIVVLGGSAGGFAVVETILRALPENFPAAICVVLHLQPTSESWLPQRLARCTKLPVHTPHDEVLQPGHVYTAIPDYHLIVKPDRVIMARGPRENLWRPAIDVLFRSAAVAHSTDRKSVV